MGCVETAAIAHLLQPFIQLDEMRLRAISTYIDLLLKWNARMNLTAIREPNEIVQRHFGESLFAAKYLLPKPKNLQSLSFAVLRIMLSKHLPLTVE